MYGYICYFFFQAEDGIRALVRSRGLGDVYKRRGFMKRYVNRWLSEIRAVIAYHTALKQHGGLAGVYVLLKKHPNQKQINREIHQKRV